MKITKIRLVEIDINHFKNIEQGKIMMDADFKKASLTGIYGQNGSGKSAVIDALAILSCMTKGEACPPGTLEAVQIGHQRACLRFVFWFEQGDEAWKVFYSITLEKKTEKGLEEGDLIIADEMVQYLRIGDKTTRTRVLARTEDSDVFGPYARYKLWIGTRQKSKLALLEEKRKCQSEGRSFLFGSVLEQAVMDHLQEEADEAAAREFELLQRMKKFGSQELLVLWGDQEGLLCPGLGFRPFAAAQPLALEAWLQLEKSVDTINQVLPALVPGLTLAVLSDGQDRKEGCVPLWMTRKNGVDLPLLLESAGIRKLITRLSAWIALYHSFSIVVAMDDLDTGIFEYLLGEVLHVLEEGGKGQLIFTCHDLRPLEVIGKECAVMTTINPANRYLRLINVKPNNNLRSFYYRDMVMSEQKEKVYEPTSVPDIIQGFVRAGEASWTFPTEEN